ncbi:DNA polymerase III tau subunit [Tepidamorphus gemmatus]|uniref:DNA polymerase III subunit gamma/tau n=2 Tax=Tepidamorphus gemmatus TaxID=747076 RepID=A0A4R3M614_9HYPH|nr:DNA polymerase III subunit gamma/tau [Tepidamorphus gemmatus]TCT08831.1 DNA polymerase III tau subunit [Tepidamorphus gemmatus]
MCGDDGERIDQRPLPGQAKGVGSDATHDFRIPSIVPGDMDHGPSDVSGRTTVGYRVLARKYRPTSFADLIGQEPMVRTLRNAFASGRIAQAYMLTGVRGVGKTTTARIIARALNYEPLEAGEGAASGPTLDLSAEGRHCRAILESRHVDVIEMDAASHTGIDDIREIIEAVRYRPAEARYKIYIIDEVHMLSKAAFNGLLKTLEEPPEHVKFIFATTEIRKVPITVLSRCQRFDLRRIDADVLVRHLAGIAAAESIAAEEEALRMIARASEGSVRDALSLLDQAIAHGGGAVRAGEVRAMLGVADRARVVDLFEKVMAGDVAAAIGELDDQYAEGAAPEMVLTDLAGFVHLVTRLRLVPETAQDVSLSEVERVRGAEFAAKVAISELSRAWQILLKGIAEVEGSPKPLAAAEMVLVRLAYAASLPSPEDIIRRLEDAEPIAAASGPIAPVGTGSGSGSGSGLGARSAIAPGTGPVRLAAAGVASGQPRRETVAQDPVADLPQPASLSDVVALAAAKRDIKLQTALERFVRIVRFEPGRIELSLADGAASDLVHDLSQKLSEWTGRRWVVAVSRAVGEPTLREQAAARRSALIDDMRRHPAVSAILETFPGAEIVDVRVEADPAVTDVAVPTDAPTDEEDESQ